MDKSTRKELLSAWKERHPEMGVVSVRCVATGDVFLDITKDAKTWFNRHRFELDGRRHRNKRLQELWNQYGESGFALATVAKLEYEKMEDVKMDDLKELLAICVMDQPSAKRI